MADPSLDQLCINTMRFLAVDTVQQANSGGHLPNPIRRASRRTGIWWGHLGKWFRGIS